MIATDPKRALLSAKRLQLRQCRYVMVRRCNGTTFKHGLKSRLQILIHPPNQLEQPSRHRELVTTLQWVTAVLASRSGYLALGGKPEVHPEWEINKDDRVRCCQPSLDAGPRPPAVHDPALRRRHLVELPRHDTFVCLHPAGKPLDLINREEREVVLFSQTPSQGRFATPCVSDDRNPLHTGMARGRGSVLKKTAFQQERSFNRTAGITRPAPSPCARRGSAPGRRSRRRSAIPAAPCRPSARNG